MVVPRPWIVLVLADFLVVVVGNGDRRVLQRVEIKPGLPDRPSLHAVAVAHLVGVPNDRWSAVAVEPLRDVKDGVRRAFEREVPAPAPGEPLRRSAVARGQPDDGAAADAPVAPLSENEP